MGHPLDNPVLASLAGPHSGFALTKGRAARYPADMSPFCALPDEPLEADWAAAAALVSPGEAVLFPAQDDPPPPGWEPVWRGDGVQLVAEGLAGQPDPEAVPLGPADVPAMLALTERTKPGPFLPRTVELGRYLGIWRDGALVAMAGERLKPPGYTEISAVCTDAAWRGQGLAERLTLAVAAVITARGEVPFLHAVKTNAGAIRLYERLGFRYRRDVVFPVFKRPDEPARG